MCYCKNNSTSGYELCVKVSTKAMVSSWLYEATMYELWIAIVGDLAHHIYFSDHPWPIGKILLWKKTYDVKKLLGVTSLNCEEREAEIYKKANEAYDALSLKLGDQVFFFDNRPIDVDALFLGHALFVLHALLNRENSNNSIFPNSIIIFDPAKSIGKWRHATNIIRIFSNDK
ncbi:mitochondrial outer membrane import complex protein METAXIN-like protein [Carex littledalei]|uniref:Mitochondrial outer membrane import complex protein METAXIN-like protein n=1 Tax=Carex littledalei TaxID=544730 RepID=A0A833VJD6_9POAL|nr:mitochondrial outer membrane import complex protein METAXIN-like protein [Carex littledalei]